MRISNLFKGGILLFALASCNRTENTLNVKFPQGNPKDVISKSEINAFVHEQLNKTGRFDWKMASDSMTWSALVQGDSILSVGYQPAGVTDLSKTIDKININDATWEAARKQILNIILENERQRNPAIT